MHSIHDVINELIQTDQRAVLATVLNVQGSAYQKEGTSMLFLENGEQIGTISAGCLETDLAIRAKNLLTHQEQNSRSITYDMRAEDDMSWGRGAGCNGIIHVLIERVTPSLVETYTHIQEQLDQQTSVKTIRYMYNNETKIDMFYAPFSSNAIDNDIRLAGNRDVSYIPSQKEATSHIFIQTFTPKKRLFIFGAGPDVPPLASIAQQVDFSVHVWDWRRAYLESQTFNDGIVREQKELTRFIKQSTLNHNDSAIIMTHDFQKDREILSYLKHYSFLKYIGILGPRKRTKRLLQKEAIPSYLHSPVGKDIGAQGPAEIAISIISDLIDAYRKIETKENKRTRSL